MRYMLVVIAAVMLHAKEFATVGTNKPSAAVAPVVHRSLAPAQWKIIQDTIPLLLSRSGRFSYVLDTARASAVPASTNKEKARAFDYLVTPDITDCRYRVINEVKNREEEADTNGMKRVTTYREIEHRADAALRITVHDTATGAVVFEDQHTARESYYRIEDLRCFLYDKSGNLIREESKSVAQSIMDAIVQGMIDSAMAMITGAGVSPETALPEKALMETANKCVRALLSSMKMRTAVIAVHGRDVTLDIGRSSGLSSRVNLAMRAAGTETVFQAYEPGPMRTEARYVWGATNGIRTGATLEVVAPVFRPDAMFASMFVPGLGHLANGFMGEGLFYCITESALIATVAVCGVSVTRSVQAVAVPTQYDLWKDTAGIMLVAAGVMLIGVHTASVIDAAVLAEEYDPLSLRIDRNTRLRVALGVDRQAIGMSLRF